MAKKVKEADRAEVLRERLSELSYEIKRLERGKTARKYGWLAGHLRGLRQEIREELGWWEQENPCSGPGYAHAAHGACPGYTYDRT